MDKKTKDIINAKLEVIENQINSFSYDGVNDLSYILPYFDELVDLLKGQNNMLLKLNHRFASIHDNLDNIINNKPKEMNLNQLPRYVMLITIMDKLEDLMSKIYNDNPINNNPEKRELIYQLIFESKNIDRIKSALDKFPHLVNVLDSNNIPLIEKVVDSYLEALDKYVSKANLGPIEDLLYYDKVLEIIMNSPKIKISNVQEATILKKINKYYKSKHYKGQRQKEKLSFFVNNLICLITKEEMDDSLAMLNYKYEIHDKFKEAHNLEAKTIYLSGYKPTGVSRDIDVYTFDGKDAYEIDDGLSIEYEDGVYTLGVHIADPNYFIKKDSIIDDEAARRTTSIYMDDECIPMYPLILSKDLMGLNEGKYKPAMSYYFKIDELTGEIFDFEIENLPIYIHKNLTYEYLDDVLVHGSKFKLFEEDMIWLKKVSDILKNKYQKIDLYTSFNDEEMTPAREIVQNCMIYTNHKVPEIFSELELPFIYRNHKIDEDKLKKLEDLETRLRENKSTESMAKIIKSMKGLYPRAYYSNKNEGHFGLSLDSYSHVTSPLRRYADIIANRCIKKFILGKYTKDDVKKMNEYIEEMTSNINQRRRSIEDYESEYLRKKYTK